MGTQERVVADVLTALAFLGAFLLILYCLGKRTPGALQYWIRDGENFDQRLGLCLRRAQETKVR